VFQITAGSIPGSDHTMPGKPVWKNNQDAWYIYQSDHITIGIIADGCGSGKKNEVGANLGVQLFGEILKTEAERSLQHGQLSFNKWERSKISFLGKISTLASCMGPSLSEVVEHFFAFSLVGFIIMPETTSIFHCGDGCYSVNDELTTIGPYPGNAPPYIAYNILGDTEPKFEITDIPTSSIENISVGSDGVDYIPDFEMTLEQWIGTDSVFENPDILRRKLALIGKEFLRGKIIVPGPLKDDTTLVIARKPPPQEEI